MSILRYSLLNKYDRVVVRTEYAKEKLTEDYKKLKDITKIEVLVNQFCLPNYTHAKGQFGI